MKRLRQSTASAYDLIADRWIDRNFSQQDGVTQHARALAFLGDASPGWSLNVGCGCNTRFNALLREHGLSLEGIDVCERMLALARMADPGVVLHHADVCDWEPPRSYRFVTAWDSIWHVRLDRQRALLLKLMAALEVGGVFVFSAGGLDGPGEHTDCAMGPELYYGSPRHTEPAGRHRPGRLHLQAPRVRPVHAESPGRHRAASRLSPWLEYNP